MIVSNGGACGRSDRSSVVMCEIQTVLWVLVLGILSFVVFFFNDTATTEIYTLSLHDALPI